MKKTLLLVMCLLMCCRAAFALDIDVNLPKPDTDDVADIHLKGPKVDIDMPDINTEGPDYWQQPVDFDEPEVDANLPKADVDITAPKVDVEPEATPAPKPARMPKTGDNSLNLGILAGAMAAAAVGYALLGKAKSGSSCK